jgi:hypothetical protein
MDWVAAGAKDLGCLFSEQSRSVPSSSPGCFATPSVPKRMSF